MKRSKEKNASALEKFVKKVLISTGENPKRNGLKETPINCSPKLENSGNPRKRRT